MKAHHHGRYLLYALLPVLVLCSCAEPAQKSGPPREDILSQPQRLGDNGDFYHRFEGQAANGDHIVMHLQKHGGEAGGVLMTGAGLPVLLLQDSEDSLRRDSTFIFIAYDPFHKKSEGASVTWTVQHDGAGWMAKCLRDTAGINYPLKEVYPGGALQLASITISDTARFQQDRPEPQARVSYNLVAAAGGTGADLLNSTVRELLGVNQGTGLDKRSLSAALADQTHGYLTAWYGEVRKIYNPQQDGEGAFMYSSSLEENVSVLRNEAGWLVLRDVTEQYSGGAHPNIESSYYSIDLKTGRAWSLADILADTVALQPLLDAAAREAFGMPKGQALAKRLLVPAVPVTENAYVLRDGLAFVYNPYEIAPYADGEIHLFVPWSQLQLLLSPAFRQRLSGEGQHSAGGSA